MGGCIRALLKCHDGEPGLIIAPTYSMLRDPVQETFFGLLRAAGIKPYHNRSENFAYVGKSKVLFRSADDPNKLRGPNLNWIYLDEAALMREEVWRICIGRLRVGNHPTAWITTTPAGYNWIWEYWAERVDERYDFVQASTAENINLDPGYVEDLENTYTGEFAKQELYGDFVAFEGLVYAEMSRSIHVIEPFEIPDSWERCRSIDFGFTNPFVCLWIAFDEDGRAYLYDEHYERKKLLEHHADQIYSRDIKWSAYKWAVWRNDAKKRNPTTPSLETEEKRRWQRDRANDRYVFTTADHDAQDVAELRKSGIYTTRAKKSIIKGIRVVSSRLKVQPDGRPRLFVFSNCVRSLREFGIYRWADSKVGRNEKEEPVKESDHAMDALRYALMQRERGVIYA